ncbi:hypothetical protein K505DRAFT_338484 [Melanomma pulvis-pyrius CBS 109.77]|uniref:Fungal N-terminal domain-containing protein n=1 Tax=Melanomma pulvis-pyrius CBS 109.77 TaxID=1314802 RepID=A0A6A6X8G4_9PLEO|nr:hypothetical protein K505DRAFT_338484 [Melanomma pulvis-pyrius CBS 109.77]
MDPVSLVVASASAGKICVSLGWSLKKFMDGAKIADKRIESLIHDIKTFGNIPDVLKETVHDPKVQSWAESGGNVRSYWEELLVCLQDSEKTLVGLEQTVSRINKSAQILDSARKELRLQVAADEIGMYQHQVSSSKSTMQVLLNTAILQGPIKLQKKDATNMLLPRSDETQQMIFNLGVLFNQKMASLEQSFQSSSDSKSPGVTLMDQRPHYESLAKMKKGLVAASSVISSASTTLGRGPTGGSTVFNGSEIGDLLSPERSEMTLSWVERISESDELSITRNDPSRFKQRVPLEQSDPEDDPELGEEMVLTFFGFAQEHLQMKEFDDAESNLKECMDRVWDSISRGHPCEISLKTLGDTVNDLVLIFKALQEFDKAQRLLREKINLFRRAPGDNTTVIWSDVLVLIEILLEKGDHEEALKHGRDAERWYRAHKVSGLEGRKKALELIAKIYIKTGKERNAKGYLAIVRRLSRVDLSGNPILAESTISVSSPSRLQETEGDSMSQAPQESQQATSSALNFHRVFISEPNWTINGDPREEKGVISNSDRASCLEVFPLEADVGVNESLYTSTQNTGGANLESEIISTSQNNTSDITPVDCTILVPHRELEKYPIPTDEYHGPDLGLVTYGSDPIFLPPYNVPYDEHLPKNNTTPQAESHGRHALPQTQQTEDEGARTIGISPNGIENRESARSYKIVEEGMILPPPTKLNPRSNETYMDRPPRRSRSTDAMLNGRYGNSGRPRKSFFSAVASTLKRR